jgi:long-chain acyl-CoA synthetase
MNIYRQICAEVNGYNGCAVIDNGLEISYTALFKQVDDCAELLRQAGVLPHARIAFIAENSARYVILSLAVLSIDAVIVPISVNTSAPEQEAIYANLEINFLLTGSRHPQHGKQITPEWYLTDLNRELRPIELAHGRRAAFIRFSSGTTAASKGVILSHQAIAERTAACTGLLIGEGGKVLWVLDMAFHFIVTIILFLRRRAALVLCPPPVETAMITLLRQYEINLLYATPYHYRLLLQSPDCVKSDLAAVQMAVSTAMRLEPADAERFTQKFGIALSQAYGIIEVGLPAVNNSCSSAKIASVGKLQPAYELKLHQPDSSGTGEIWLRGPGMFDAYFAPFRLRTGICPDGWFNTGDLGYLDQEGYLFIAGRTKQLINFMGMKIFPESVETVINQYPLVAESRVFGKKFSAGEYPAAELVLNPGGELNDVELMRLRRYLFAALAGYAVPKEFSVVPALPRTASGKIIR